MKTQGTSSYIFETLAEIDENTEIESTFEWVSEPEAAVLAATHPEAGGKSQVVSPSLISPSLPSSSSHWR